MNYLKTCLAALAVVASFGFASIASAANPILTDLATEATALTTDAGTALTAALGVAVAIFGAIVLWRLFKRVARG